MAVILRDHYGSVDRLRKQYEKDEAELARPVRSAFSGGVPGVYLNLRPQAERIAASNPGEKTPLRRLLRRLKKQLGRRQFKAQWQRMVADASGEWQAVKSLEPTS